MNQDIKSKYIKKFKIIKSKQVDILGVCIKEGQNLSGTELAPNVIRNSGLKIVLENLGWTVNDNGNVSVDSEEMTGQEFSPETPKSLGLYYTGLQHCETIGYACKQVHNHVKTSSQNNNFSLVLGGDHGIATGTISGMLETYPNLKVVWVDAHGDCNIPETSPSGHYHGMPVGHLLGWFRKKVLGFEWLKFKLKPENIVFIGLRDIDEEEKELLINYNIKYYCMHKVEKHGISNVMKKTFKYLKIKEDDSALHVSFDIDAVDPMFAPGTGTKAKGGLTYREAHYICRSAAETGKLVSMEMVEVNPLLEEVNSIQHIHGDDKNIRGTKTVGLAIELIKSALGHTLV